MKQPEHLFDLRGKVAVVTGGSGILGGAMAKGLWMNGASVVLLGTNEEKVKKKTAEISGTTDRLSGFVCNVLDANNLTAVHSKIIERFGTIDILINAAGGNMPGATVGTDQTIFDINIEDFKKVTDLNFLGTVLPILEFGKTMSAKKSGSIINISSMAAQRILTRVAGYSAAKAAVDNFTKWLAVEMANKFGSGIRVNAIAPGFFLTEQNRTLLTNSDGSLTDRGKSIIQLTPFKRFGEPEELIGTAVWLASDASRFVTGTVVTVDGGFSAFSGI